MNLSQHYKKEILKLRKNALIVIGVLLLIQLWFLWDVRNKMSIDYSFLIEKTSKINAIVFSINEFTVERDGDRGESYSNNAFEYNYRFFLNGKTYIGKDFTVLGNKNDGDTPFSVDIEYLDSDPNINRIGEFAYIKSGYDFFREYFMVKIIILLITVFFLVFDFKERKRKILAQERSLSDYN